MRTPNRNSRFGLAYINTFLDFVQKLLLLLITLIVLTLFGFVAYTGIYKEMVVVERFSVSKDIQDIGYTNQAFERQVCDKIMEIITETTSLKPYQSVLTYDKVPRIEIQQGGVTVKSFIQSLGNSLSRKRKLVQAEVTTEKKGAVTLTVRVEGNRPARFTESLEKLDLLVNKAALYILRQTEPYMLAAYYQVNGETDKVLELIHKCIIRGQPKDEPWAYNLWGIHLLEKGAYKEATGKFKKATGIAPNFGIAYLNWGIALEHIDTKLDASIEKYTKATELLQNFAPAYHMYGTALLRKGRIDEAIVQFRKALELDPKNAEILKDLGYSLTQKTRLKESLRLLETAADLAPADPDVYFYLGLTKQKLGFMKEAKDYYLKAIRLDPDHKNALNQLRMLKDAAY